LTGKKILTKVKRYIFPCPRYEGIQGGVEVYIHSFLKVASNGGELLTPNPIWITPRKETRYQLNEVG